MIKSIATVLIVVGFVGIVFADDSDSITSDYSESEYTCDRPICLIDSTNDKKPTAGSDHIFMVKVEPETKFTVRVFDSYFKPLFNKSVFSDKNGIASIAYPIPPDVENADYEITMTSYTSKGAVHTGALLRVGDKFSSSYYDGPPRIIHAHMEHDDHHYNPLVVEKQINMRIITNYKFENNSTLPLEFTIYDPQGKILEEGTVVNEKDKTARYYFTAKTDGLHTVVAKSDSHNIEEHNERFGILKSKYIIHENDRDYPIVVNTRDEPTIAINSMKFDKDAKKIAFEVEPTWSIQDALMVEIPYGLLDGPYNVFVDGQLQDMEYYSGYGARIFLRGDLTVLAIPLEYNSSKIEIVGTTVFPKTSEKLTVNAKTLDYKADETMTIHGTSIPEENLFVKVYGADDTIVFSDIFASGQYGIFEHDVFDWPKHSLDFPDGRYTVEVSSQDNQERIETIEIKFQNRHDFFSGFQQIPLKDQLKSFEFQPKNIACKESLTLVIKDHANSPACVFPATAEKLLQRGGWSTIEHKIGISWLYDSEYRVNGKGTVQVVDSRMNMHSETVEKFHVYVWSESDSEGIELQVMETGPDTDTFEGEIFFSDETESPSSKDKLFVSAGDLVQVFHKNMVDEIRVNEK